MHTRIDGKPINRRPSIENPGHSVIDNHGYVRIYVPGHPRANSSGYVSEHVYIAERALGGKLPPKANVHHVDGNRGNNAHTNLVICENQAYHKLLHCRQKLISLGGSPDLHSFCIDCKTIKDLSAFATDNNRWNRRSQYCRECSNVRLRRSRYQCRLRDEAIQENAFRIWEESRHE